MMINTIQMKLSSGKLLEFTYDEAVELHNDLSKLFTSNKQPESIFVNNKWVKPAWQQMKYISECEISKTSQDCINLSIDNGC